MLTCANCYQGLHQFCYQPPAAGSDCCCLVAGPMVSSPVGALTKEAASDARPTVTTPSDLAGRIESDSTVEIENTSGAASLSVPITSSANEPNDDTKHRGYGAKPLDEFKDQLSTGRKRAAKLYPFVCEKCEKEKKRHNLEDHAFTPKPCDWRGLAAAGGNNHIVGCINGFQQARHHGPDKNTLNNERGNVHLICHNCHTRWHERNDEERTGVPYPYGAPTILHDPVTYATPEQLAENEAYWSMNKPKRRTRRWVQ